MTSGDELFNANSNYTTSWQRIQSNGRLAFQIHWIGCHDINNNDENLDGLITIELSMDSIYPSEFFSIILDIGNNTSDTLIYDFETAVKYWRVAYIANSITAGTIYITN